MVKDHEFAPGLDDDQHDCIRCNVNAWINFRLCQEYNKFLKLKNINPGKFTARVTFGKRIYIVHRKTGRRMGIVPCISNNAAIIKDIIE